MSDHQSAAQMVLSTLTILLRVWGAFGLPIARFLVTNWVRVYTHPATGAVRSDRRSEIASDLAEQIAALRAEGYHPSEIGARLLVRMLFGIWSDLNWMAFHLEVLESARHSRLVVNAVLDSFYLLRPWAEREMAASKASNQQAFRGPLGTILFALFASVLLFVIEEAVHERDKLSQRVVEIERRLKIGGVWPEDRRALEAEASVLRKIIRRMFDPTGDSEGQADEAALG